MRIITRCFVAGLAVSEAVLAAIAQPTPIVRRDSDNSFRINANRSFAPSGLTLELRRFAGPFPDDVVDGVPRRPRLNGLTFAQGVAGPFIVSAGAFGSPSARGALLHVSPDGSTITEVLEVSAFFTLPRDIDFLNQQGGFRSAAFHPGFGDPGSPGYGKLFTTQSVTRPADTTGLRYIGDPRPPIGVIAPNDPRHDGSLVEWTAAFDEAGMIESIGSPRELYRVATPSGNHPIKAIAFDPFARPGDEDYGLLYVLHPDGTNTSGPESGTGQRGDDALGKVFRIDPLDPDGDAGPLAYGVPPTNPFFGADGLAPGGGDVLDEAYAIGMRDQHTISFAPNPGGPRYTFVADIGSNHVEEINRLVPGGNYGWNDREGTFRFDTPGISGLPASDPRPYEYPVAQYGHRDRDGDHAIVGGYVIRPFGSAEGYYVFGDFTRDAPLFAVPLSAVDAAVTAGEPGEITPAQPLTVGLSFDHDDDPATPAEPRSSFLDVLDDEPTYDGSGRTDLRFGQGPDGTLYLLNKRNGLIYLVVDGSPANVNRDGAADRRDVLSLIGLISARDTAGDLDGDGTADFFDAVKILELLDADPR